MSCSARRITLRTEKHYENNSDDRWNFSADRDQPQAEVGHNKALCIWPFKKGLMHRGLCRPISDHLGLSDWSATVGTTRMCLPAVDFCILIINPTQKIARNLCICMTVIRAYIELVYCIGLLGFDASATARVISRR